MGLRAEKIFPSVYRITGGGCDCYLLKQEKAVLIDCGCGKENIRAFAENLIHQPVSVVLCTHSHIDHTGHCGLFDTVYMTQRTYASSRNWMDEDPAVLHLDYQPTLIQDGQILDFDGNQIEVIGCDCHAPGNVMFLDKKRRILFTGDEVDQGQVLLLPGFSEKAGQVHSENAATVHEYQKLLIRVWNRRAEFDWLCTGHNGSPLKKEALSILIELCEAILQGKKGSRHLASSTYSEEDTHFPYSDAHYLRFTHKGFSLIYCSDSLMERSKNSQIVPATPLHRMCEENNQLMKGQKN